MTDSDSPANGSSVGRSNPGARSSAVAAVLSLVGLLIGGLLTVQVYRTWTPKLTGGQATDSGTTVPIVVETGNTPAPSDLVVTNPDIAVPGTLVYVKAGELWVQSGTTTRQLTQSTDGSQASQPAWSPDGQWIYYIDTQITRSRWYDPDALNVIAPYTLTYPVLCRIHPDGTGRQEILSSLIRQGALQTFFWIRQPSISPSGATAVVVSDGPTVPGASDVVLHFVTINSGKLGAALPLSENTPLGLADPAFSPDGSRLAYVMEGRSGKNGAPSIWLYDIDHRTSHKLAAGYRGPSWSPDGRYLAATRVSGDTLDVVVLDAVTGTQVGQVTSDGASWAPVWSPAGDELVYMHLTGAVVDLYMVHIGWSAGNPTFKIEPHLTEYSGLDGGSAAAWYIPGAPPSPSETPTAGPSASASGPSSASVSAAPS